MRIPTYRGEAPEEVTDDDLEVADEGPSARVPETRGTVVPVEEDADGEV